MKTDILKERLRNRNISFCENKSFKNLTSFKTGGEASLVLYPENAEEIIFIRETAKNENIPLIILGKGSNCLAPDEFFDGMVVVTKESFNKIFVEGSCLTAESGASLSAMALLARDKGLSGLEFSYGIPGTLGGAVLMNAGAYGGEIKDVIRSVTYLDENNQIHTIENEACLFDYRTSIFDENDYFILSAEISLKEGNKEEIESCMEEILAKRRDKQPLEYPSAGSGFKRPQGYFAAALIDECNLKGLTVGGAQVSEKHAGFIINRDNATSADIKELCKRVHDIVLKEKQVDLETEIRFL